MNFTAGILIAGSAFLGKVLLKLAWEKFKPFKPVVTYTRYKAYLTGVKTRKFLINRGKGMGAGLIDELVDSSEIIQDAFVMGLEGKILLKDDVTSGQ